MMNIYVLILAAGRGRRAGAGKNKVLVDLAGKTALSLSADAFFNLPEITKIIVTAAPGEEDAIRQELTRSGHPALIVTGGESRQESVLMGLEAISGLDRSQRKKRSVVLVHDAARCFILPSLIRSVLGTVLVERCGAAPAVPVGDTVRRADGRGFVLETPPRDGLFAVQTPQGADLDILLDAYRMTFAKGLTVTDDLFALEQIGYPVRLIPGDIDNFKVTTKSDLEYARYLVKSGLGAKKEK